MSRRKKLLLEPLKASLLSTSAERKAVWLKGEYDASKWLVRDDYGPDEEVLNFEFRMPDGRCLMQTPNWLKATREFTFWIREGPYAAIRDAKTHQRWHRVALNTFHGLALRGYKSCEQITEVELEDYFEDSIAFGVDGILMTEARIEAYLKPFRSVSDLPKEIVLRKPRPRFNSTALLEACNLPNSLTKSIGRKLDEQFSRFGSGESPTLDGPVIDIDPDNDNNTPLVDGSLQHYLAIFEAQYALRGVMDCPTIRFNPFLEESANQMASRFGRGSTPTPIAPHKLMIKLFEGCAKILVNDWDNVARTYLETYQDYLNSTVAWAAFNRARSSVVRVVRACFILITGFTARRPGEVLLLLRDCLAGNDEFGWWLQVTVIKNHDHVKTWVTIPNVIARAVRILIEVVDLHRDEATTDELFRFYDPPRKRFTTVDVITKTTAFASELGAVTHTENGIEQEWHWYPRQFRRFFAVVFYHRFNGGLETLCHEMRHWSVDHTRGYIALNTEAARYWIKTEQEFKRHIATQIANDEEEFTGPLANRYRKLADRLKRGLRNKVTLVDRTVADMIVRSMGREANVFSVNAWGTCGCPNSKKGTEKANCRTPNDGESFGANLKNAGTSVCGNCPWGMQNAAQREYVARDAAETKAILDNDCRPQNIFKMLQERRYLRLVAFVEDAA
ncbi:hypothetical protein [Rhizobium leguminosarum]|uniref:hypothetical protein n=1 Tax=Rhizobium leguminosarum TaxID=384 RepID=UPI00103D06EA|nr:hypothetical protein [Rhizobium leguminosarum]TCA57161.1 hypothetical protein E0H41_26520 [Rhizobium leguminosarum bv. viciae]TCB22080.1 hypothetical protein E0J09_25860 [Rhizobium leguminosarum bv. viciae]